MKLARRSRSAVERDHPETFAEHLRRQAARYFERDGAGSPDVTLAASRLRRMSAMYEYRVSIDGRVRNVLVKVHHSRDPERRRAALKAGRGDRPRLAPWIDPDLHPAWEFAALRAIEQRVTADGDPRFAAVRMLDLLPEQGAIVMERLPFDLLEVLYLKHHRMATRHDAPALDRAFRHAGAWLHHYHAAPCLEHTRRRHTTRFEFLETLRALADYNALLGTWYGELGRRAERLARARLPAELPTGLGHGDYGPRNVLVGPEQQVAVIDTRSAWGVSIHEDLGYFLLALRTNALQLYSQGLALAPGRVARCEREFLRGYFVEREVPLAAVRLFQVLALLDYRAKLVHGLRDTSGLRRVAKAGRFRLSNGYLTRLARALLEEAERGSPGPALEEGDGTA